MPRRSPRIIQPPQLQPLTRCPFLQVDASVFALICSFLSLEVKLVSIAPLCRGAFDAARVCREDTIIINGVRNACCSGLPSLSLRAVGQLKNARYVKSLMLAGSMPGASTDQINVTSCIRAAIVSPALRSLRVVDSSVNGVNTMHVLLHNLVQSGAVSRLRSFAADYGPHGEVPVSERAHAYYKTPRFSWSGLSQMTSLTHLDLHIHRNESLVGLTQFLPATLTELHVIAAFEDVEKEWHTAFERTTFLPRLETFEANDLLLTEFMFTTIMSATNLCRPFQALRWSHLSASQLSLLPPSVTKIEAAMQATAAGLDVVCHDRVPDLDHVHIHVSDDFDELPVMGPKGFQCTSMLAFLACRPIQELNLTLQCDTEPLSDDAVRSLALMTSLKVLSITSLERYQQVFIQSRDISQVLPPNSWPKLERLLIRLRDVEDFEHFQHLHFYVDEMLPITHLNCFAAAAPNLKHLMCNIKEPAHLPIAALGACCPTIETLHFLRHELDSQTHISYGNLVQMLTSFERPLAIFQNLTNIVITTHQFEDRALHYLFAQLGPNVTKAEFKKGPDEQCGRARFFFSIFRSLGSLSGMKLMGDSTDADLDFVFDMYHRDQPSGGGFEFIQPFRMNETALFQNHHQSSNRTGRKAFFDALCDSLDEIEQKRLAAWDEGNYEWQPNRRSKRIRERDDVTETERSALRRKFVPD